MLQIKLYLFTLLCRLSLQYRVLLLFPVPSKSHALLGEGYVRHLLDAGHEVTYITPIKIREPHLRLRQIDISSNYALLPVDQYYNIAEIIKVGHGFDDITQNLYIFADFAYGTLMHPNIQELILDTKEHFDVVIAEWLLNELYSGLSTVFNCPLIWSSSLEPHSLALELIDDTLNPAYNPSYRSDAVPPFNFLDRVNELWIAVKLIFHKWWLRSTEDRYFANAFAASFEKKGLALPILDEIRYNASLMFGNSNVAAGSSIRLPQNYIAIGGYHIKEHVDSLPTEIQKVMDNAQNGAIYFSMGSILQSSSIPHNIKRELLDTFRKLNLTIIWKYEEEVAEIPQNLHIVPWAPQTAILAHPNCKLFITHGGLLSITEAIHFRVPIIGIPLFSDQNVNMNRAVKKGFGIKLNYNSDFGVHLEAAIKEVLYNERYYKKIEEYSSIYHDRVTPPGKLLTHWVSHVVRTNGAQYLRSSALLMPSYQKLYIDLAVVILVTLYIVWRISLEAFKIIVLNKRTLFKLKKKYYNLYISIIIYAISVQCPLIYEPKTLIC